MIDITLDMQQYDCPFIDTTADVDVSFAAVHWEFDEGRHELETRMLVEGADRGALENGLHTITDHRNMHECRLLAKQGEAAHIRTTIEETDAMGVIRANGGYVTGPFYIEGGTEEWHVGFDRSEAADATLAGLERNNEFRVIEREEVDLTDVTDFVRNADAATTLIEGCRSLSETERETLAAAVGEGFFQTPREADLGTLADRFDVSRSAVSKNLRRGQEKVISRLVQALEELDDAESRADPASAGDCADPADKAGGIEPTGTRGPSDSDE